jgi:hypothetical protein
VSLLCSELAGHVNTWKGVAKRFNIWDIMSSYCWHQQPGYCTAAPAISRGITTPVDWQVYENQMVSEPWRGVQAMLLHAADAL